MVAVLDLRQHRRTGKAQAQNHGSARCGLHVGQPRERIDLPLEGARAALTHQPIPVRCAQGSLARAEAAEQTCTVASWAQFEAEAPELAAVAARLWPGIVELDRGRAGAEGAPCFVVSYLASVRRDGAPRLHPFCPILAGGRLFAAIPRLSPKGWDLRRDPRCVIHALPGPEDDELCVRARACEVTDGSPARAVVREVVARSGVGGMIESVTGDPLFEFDLEQVDVARWLDISQPGTRAVRGQWRASDGS